MITARRQSYLAILRFLAIALFFSACAGSRKPQPMPEAFYEWTRALQVMTQNLLAGIKKYDNGFDWYAQNRQQYLELGNRLKLLRWQAEGTLNNEPAAKQILKIEETLLAIKRLYLDDEKDYRNNLKYLPQLQNILDKQFEKLRNPAGANDGKTASQIAGRN